MSDVQVTGAAAKAKRKRRVMPATQTGRWALVMAVAGVVWFVMGPIITMNFRTTYPITDSWVMPTIGLVLIDAAAVVNIIAIKRSKEDALASIIGMAVIGALAAFVTIFVVGEGIGSFFGFTE